LFFVFFYIIFFDIKRSFLKFQIAFFVSFKIFVDNFTNFSFFWKILTIFSDPFWVENGSKNYDINHDFGEIFKIFWEIFKISEKFSRFLGNQDFGGIFKIFWEIFKIFFREQFKIFQIFLWNFENLNIFVKKSNFFWNLENLNIFVKKSIFFLESWKFKYFCEKFKISTLFVKSSKFQNLCENVQMSSLLWKNPNFRSKNIWFLFFVNFLYIF